MGLIASDTHFRVGEIDAMSVEESELWYWRYATETIHTTDDGRPNYIQLVYEDLVAHPIDVAKHLDEKCHLSWTKVIEAEISGRTYIKGTVSSRPKRLVTFTPR